MSDSLASYGKNFRGCVKVFRKYVKGHDQGHVSELYFTTRKVMM